MAGMNERLPAGGPLTPEEETAVRAALHVLLLRQTRLYTQGDSTSLPEETAAELLRSLCHTLRLSPDSPPEDYRLFLARGADASYAAGLSRVEGRLKAAKRLFQAACATAPNWGSLSLRDTLRDIGGWLRRYDARFFAHRVPGGIDYQLCAPAPETLCGADYVIAYLRRLLAENDLLRRVNPLRARRLVGRVSPDYRELLINLSEQPAANAVAAALTDGDVRALTVTEETLRALARRFGPLSPAEARAVLSEGAERMCAALGIEAPEGVRYWRALAAGLAPRVEAALPYGGLAGVFSPLP